MKRKALDLEDDGGAYFATPSSHKFISSGSTLLDLAIGGGIGVLGRMTNIIGDKSTGKTLLAIEASANFARTYPKGKIWYRETEAAFDEAYAETVGMPVARTSFGAQKLDTVEDFAKDLQACCRDAKAKGFPGLYILDSMDALSDNAEKAREFGEATFGAGKSKANSELFRKLTREIESANICLVIVSQIRDAIGVTFGDKTRRSGGHALDFYASVAMKLAHIGRIGRTIKGVDREVGVKIKAKIVKNKISDPFRDAEFSINFGFGINDAASCLDWLITLKRTQEIELGVDEAKKLLPHLKNLDRESYEEWREEIIRATKKVWAEVELGFRPTWRKY